ncbi:hypothetical protein [Novosphingobium pentaromativorans]|uniref:Uncharacterized protein n=1 Tax=Novosphingobium pentaromativorans US6-1 TaxID=1088721 RepID=G6ECH6_9SPHN|nr:hypothetical protein [Novosphingobium pentaromativorans]AIT80052.1 signal peptide protein [Novosphingobium pentaromativorans US6-1]EHJ60887.1 hypothetical protein NSU_2047 [Novosphingobium pentaromativorans US6-1]
MSELAGTYECITKSPMGDQKGTLTVIPGSDGGTFTGTMVSATGSLEVEDGRIDGNRLTWTVNMTVPMPMKLEGDATVEGGKISGHVKAGMFGNMGLEGTKTA